MDIRIDDTIENADYPEDHFYEGGEDNIIYEDCSTIDPNDIILDIPLPIHNWEVLPDNIKTNWFNGSSTVTLRDFIGKFLYVIMDTTW